MSIDGRVASTRRVFLALVVVALAAGSASAQRTGEAVGWINRDYFLKDTDPDTSLLVSKVERAHLSSANFFKWYNAQEWQYAIGDLQYALWVFPNHPKALYFMGAIAKTTNRLTLPIPYFQNAIKLFPRYALTHAQYGSYLTDIGELERGAEKLKAALQLDPNLAVAHAWLAKAYAKQHRDADARAEAARARELGFKGAIDTGGETGAADELVTDPNSQPQ